MLRRDLLRAAAGLAALPGAGGTRPRRRGAGDPWAFSLDERLRWSLAADGGEPVVDGAEIAVELAGAAPVPLRALEGVRRFRFGARDEPAGWSVVGTTGGLEITVRLVDGAPEGAVAAGASPWPVVAVSVRGLEGARALTAVHFLDTARAGVPALEGRSDRGRERQGDGGDAAGTLVLVNGYQSWSPCQVVGVGGSDVVTGHWQLATLTAPGGLGLCFGSDDAGTGEFTVGGGAVRAAARFGGRLVGAAYPPAASALTVLPSDAPLEALGAAAARGRDRALPAEVPAGWCSWYELYGAVTEDDVLANLDFAGRSFDPRAFRVIQVDDGFQRAVGDWDVNAKFPHGHRWLTDRIHAKGFLAGLWLAPFAVAERSGVPQARAAWLLREAGGAPLVLAERDAWGGRVYGLDASQRAVQDHLRDLMRHVTLEWGYDYLKLDFLHYGALGAREGRWQSGAEAYRLGLRALREGAGRAYVLGCGAPLQHALGLVDGMRIGEDVDATWEGLQPAAAAALRRAHLHRRAWHDDPDALVVREPLTLAEAQAWASLVALTGQMTLASDRMERLPPERVELLQRTIPVAPVAGRALDLATPERVEAPALWAGGARVASLPGSWLFRPGDEPVWADAALDDSGWEPLAAGVPWEEAGRRDLDGFAWYRVHFRAPRTPPAGALQLELGRVDDVDETFVNGRRVGGTGSFPPAYASAWQGWRRYAVPRDAIRWGRDNVVAVRAYDGGGPGGLYSFRRGRPPAWVLAPVRPDWWMLAAVNWDDEPRRMTLDLAAHGVAGPLVGYDVWRDARVGDVDGRWTGRVAARSATVLSLRRRPRWPCVVGATRHIVQGAVDLADERWDARRRVLSGRARALDGRGYALTIALPPGFTARSCRADADCRLVTTWSGAGTPLRAGRGAADAPRAPRAVRLEFPGRPGQDLSWEVSF